MNLFRSVSMLFHRRLAPGILAIALTFLAGGEAKAQLQLTYTGICPGQITLKVTGAIPNDRVAFVYGFGPGFVPIPQCPGQIVNIAAPIIAAVVRASALGEASVAGFVGPPQCNLVCVQAVDYPGCFTSNVVTVGEDVVSVHPFIGGILPPPTDYCQYIVSEDCLEVGIRAGDTICISCPNVGGHCPGHERQITIIIYKSDCKTEICRLKGTGTLATCDVCTFSDNKKFIRCN